MSNFAFAHCANARPVLPMTDTGTMNYRIPSLVIAALIMFSTRFATACPTCKDGLHQNGAAVGYAISILFMMGMPMLIAVFWAVTIRRLRTKMKTEQPA